MFKEIFEAKNPILSQVKKVIKSVDLDLLDHQAYEAEVFNTDAGMGGEKVIRVWMKSTRSKDTSDNKKVQNALSKKFDVTPHGTTLLIIRNK